MPTPIDIARSLVLTQTQRVDLLTRWPAERRARKQANDLYTDLFWRVADSTDQRLGALKSQVAAFTAAIDRMNKDADAFEDALRRGIEKARNDRAITAEDVRGSGLGALPLVLGAIVVAIIAVAGVAAFAYCIGSPVARAQALTLGVRLKAQIDAVTASRTAPTFPALPGETAPAPAPSPGSGRTITDAVSSVGSFGVVLGAIVLVAMLWKGGRS